MITPEFAEKLYIRMQEHSGAELDTGEIETLAKLMSSDVMLKAFGQALSFCRNTEIEMSRLNMGEPGSVIEFTRGQGQIQGVNKIIEGILGLITEKDEIPND